jgi:putative endonuclease
MWLQKGYFVYIMSSQRRVLYVGITSNLPLRVWQHKTGAVEGFTSKYKVTQLVYYESFENVRDAIRREKEIKGWIRQKKIALIESVNPKWKDLSAGWFNRQSDEKLRKTFASMNRIGRKHVL